MMISRKKRMDLKARPPKKIKRFFNYTLALLLHHRGISAVY
jgi:hypothetical protein